MLLYPDKLYLMVSYLCIYSLDRDLGADLGQDHTAPIQGLALHLAEEKDTPDPGRQIQVVALDVEDRKYIVIFFSCNYTCG